MENNLHGIVKRQKDALAELEKEVKTLENSALVKEKEKLKEELTELKEAFDKTKQNVKVLSDQNVGLKNALHEQVYNEKVKIVGSSKEKLETYFKKTAEKEVNRLTALEQSIKNRINYMTSVLQQNNVDAKDDIYQRLDELSTQVNLKVTQAQKQFAKEHGAFSEEESTAYEALKKEQITDEQVLAVTKKNNFERFVGLNVLNIMGVLLIIVGVIAAARYTTSGGGGEPMSDNLKGMLMFALGAVMLIAGEILSRKKPNIFSLGVTAGGVGVLYAALATSYFGLKILDLYPALGLCVVITVVAFLLSTRHNAQVILAFALTGGYLPIFSLEENLTLLYGTMAYFVVLNLLALFVSLKKKWVISVFVGLFLNIAGTAYICWKFVDDVAFITQAIVILYILFAFLNYTLIPVVGTYISKLKFKKHDIALLAVNTVFSSVIMYLMFYKFEWQDFTGALAIVFAIIYLSLGALIERKFMGEKMIQALFYLTGLVFVILMIPFQFGKEWLTFGWLAEGLVFAVYGILKEEKIFKHIGFSISGVGLFSFLFIDLQVFYYLTDEFYYLVEYDYVANESGDLFPWKYLAVTGVSLILLGAYIYKKTLSGSWQKFYKYAAILNLWFYAIYLCSKLKVLIGRQEEYSTTWFVVALGILFTFIIAYFAPRIKTLSDLGTKNISRLMYVVGVTGLFVLNLNRSPVHDYTAVGTDVFAIAATAVVFICLLSVFAVRDLVKPIVIDHKLGVQWYPLLVSAYFVILLTQNLITQVELSFASAWISIIYVVTALVWIIFGFAKRYSFIRKFSLCLALLSVVKLFIIDLWSLTEGYRIVSYFALGVSLVAISFVYQYFNKRLEVKMEVADDVQEYN